MTRGIVRSLTSVFVPHSTGIRGRRFTSISRCRASRRRVTETTSSLCNKSGAIWGGRCLPCLCCGCASWFISKLGRGRRRRAFCRKECLVYRNWLKRRRLLHRGRRSGMTLLIASDLRGFCLQSFCIRSSANADLRREATYFRRFCIILLAFVLLGGSVYKRLGRLEGNLLARGLGCVLSANQQSRERGGDGFCTHQLMVRYSGRRREIMRGGFSCHHTSSDCRGVVGGESACVGPSSSQASTLIPRG